MSSGGAVQRIGVFDSGVGGLTVLREVYRQLPQESVLYFGDTARLPYGTRSPEAILQYVREILTWMTTQRVKMVLMACNTSSAIALEQVRAEFEMPLLGVILPGARAAAEQGARIGVLATPATVQSQAYGQAIHEARPAAQVWQVPCPEFVPLIEQGHLDDPQTRHVVQARIRPLVAQGIDTLVYGCTHYPHLDPILARLLPPHIRRIDPAAYLVRAAAQELDVLGLKATQPAQPTRFAVSGSPKTFGRLAQRWLGYQPRVEKVHLPTAQPTPTWSVTLGPTL